MLRSERRRTCQYQHHHKFDQRIKKECLSPEKPVSNAAYPAGANHCLGLSAFRNAHT